MKIKTSKLIGALLDWAVAECEGKGNEFLQFRKLYPSLTRGPSNSWVQGGQIIDREKIGTAWDSVADQWIALGEAGPIWGPTPLIAAMRSYVSSNLGNEVEVPEELSCK